MKKRTQNINTSLIILIITLQLQVKTKTMQEWVEITNPNKNFIISHMQLTNPDPIFTSHVSEFPNTPYIMKDNFENPYEMSRSDLRMNGIVSIGFFDFKNPYQNFEVEKKGYPEFSISNVVLADEHEENEDYKFKVIQCVIKIGDYNAFSWVDREYYKKLNINVSENLISFLEYYVRDPFDIGDEEVNYKKSHIPAFRYTFSVSDLYIEFPGLIFETEMRAKFIIEKKNGSKGQVFCDELKANYILENDACKDKNDRQIDLMKFDLAPVLKKRLII